MLNALVKRGLEFPDAVHKCAIAFKCDQGELEAMYDAQFSTGSQADSVQPKPSPNSTTPLHEKTQQ